MAQRVEKYSYHYDIGQMFNNIEVKMYVHNNGTYHMHAEVDCYLKQLTKFPRYIVYCHECGTTKEMDGNNLKRSKSCGCRGICPSRNFNWEGKSTKI